MKLEHALYGHTIAVLKTVMPTYMLSTVLLQTELLLLRIY